MYLTSDVLPVSLLQGMVKKGFPNARVIVKGFGQGRLVCFHSYNYEYLVILDLVVFSHLLIRLSDKLTIIFTIA